jgi:hypothetical protein
MKTKILQSYCSATRPTKMVIPFLPQEVALIVTFLQAPVTSSSQYLSS